MRADFCDFACVADSNAARASFGGLRNERAKAFGQFEVGTNAAVLISGKRGEIHGVSNDSFGKVIADLDGDLSADFFLRFLGRAGDVRGPDNIGQTDEWGVLRWLFDEDVKSCATDTAAF